MDGERISNLDFSGGLQLVQVSRLKVVTNMVKGAFSSYVNQGRSNRYKYDMSLTTFVPSYCTNQCLPIHQLLL